MIQESEPELPWIERPRGIERGLYASRDLETGPEFLGHQVCELHADAVHVFHRASERKGPADHFIDRDGDAARAAARSGPTGRRTSRETSSGWVQTPNPMGRTP